MRCKSFQFSETFIDSSAPNGPDETCGGGFGCYFLARYYILFLVILFLWFTLYTRTFILKPFFLFGIFAFYSLLLLLLLFRRLLVTLFFFFSFLYTVISRWLFFNSIQFQWHFVLNKQVSHDYVLVGLCTYVCLCSVLYVGNVCISWIFCVNAKCNCNVYIMPCLRYVF